MNERVVDVSKAAIRERAIKFANDWQGVSSEASEKQTFWNEFFAVFGVTRRQVAAFEELAKRASTGRRGWIDLLYPGQMAVEHKSRGENLDDALGQLVDYVPGLPSVEVPWLLVVSDFERLAWKNLDTGQSGEFPLVEFLHNLDTFYWIAGHGASEFALQDAEEANLKATDLMAKLYDQLAATRYDEHAVREWLTRILFCLFADDTDVWPRAAFHTWVVRYTHNDGRDLGPMLAQLFEVLDTPPDQRATTLDEDLAEFTYINGDLFRSRLPIPSCNEAIRTALLDACKFSWAVISPSIFGSMFQNVMQPKERRSLGAHYTTEENILRVIKPLFVDDLEAELVATSSRPQLERFLDKLPTLKFMDPACGCGNFLVIAYRELRRLETEGLRRLAIRNRQSGARTFSLDLLVKVNVAQFFGIELEEFPARIARTALYLTDHIANREISTEFGEMFLRFPIPASPHVENTNALQMDWGDLLPAEEADFVFGNPPFVGFNYLSPEQTNDSAIVLGASGAGRAGRLDYVANWYAKACLYGKDKPVRFAFVSTNSITQGEQARSLGPFLMSHGFKLDFAYTTFEWTSEARGRAHVYVVIIGFSYGGRAAAKTLFDFEDIRGEPKVSRAANINWYLASAPDVVIDKRRRGFIDLPTMTQGSQPIDAGGLIVEPADYPVVMADPIASKYVRKLIGTQELLHHEPRWCLWLEDAEPSELRSSPILQERLARVRAFRLISKTPAANRMANTPSLFVARRQPKSRYLCIPRHSSEHRRIIPMAYFDPDVVLTDAALSIENCPMWLFGVMQSAMFTSWAKAVCGRIKGDPRIEADLSLHTFPFEVAIIERASRISVAAQAVLDARASFPASSLADLYGELSTPEILSVAHDELDRAVDSAFAPRRRFATNADRLAMLFERYQQLTSPLLATLRTTEKRSR